MLHIKRTCFALLSWTFSSFFTIIKLQFNDYLLQIMFALFKYNEWFSEKVFSMAVANSKIPFFIPTPEKKIHRPSFSNVNWV